VTAEIFKKHQGFDIANFDNYQYPLSEIHTFKILKSETYDTFKEKISQTFIIPPEKIQFWGFEGRQNRTIRPQTFIQETHANTSNTYFFVFNFLIIITII
jgi:ubiquitin carboxyl-terminal hydrolase 7